ncbi:MAG: helix-turn-helix domain-containing protein [candidate division WOR-3 bacterium]|nr:helix-turn-helix domain-containing protein [candidate division WOR-3 bacterium]
MDHELGRRLKKIRKQLGMTQKQFAKSIGGGCTSAFISAIEKGKSKPSCEILMGVERLGFSAHWLMTGEGKMIPSLADAVRDGNIYGYKEIPLVGEVAAGLGKQVPEDEVKRMIGVFLGEHSQCECFASEVVGISMEPLFRTGDIIIIDKSCPVMNGDIAVVVVQEQVMLKRVLCDKDKVYLLSLKDNVPPLVVDKKSDARIIGKVIQLMRWRF